VLMLAGAASPQVEACGPEGQQAWLCRVVVSVTDSVAAGKVARYLVPWISVALIVLVALLVYRLVRLLIGRWVRRAQAATEDTGRLRRWRPMGAGASSADPLRRAQRARTIGGALQSFTAIFVVIVASLAGIYALGFDLRPILAGAGLIGVVIGFGAQQTVRDLLAGTFLVLEDQFGVGDTIDVGEAVGTVEEVSLRVTRLRDLQGVVWYVPNGEIRRVGNQSQQWARVVLDLPVALDTDVERASAVLSEAAAAVVDDPDLAPLILGAPEVLGVQDIGAQGIVLRVVVKTEPNAQWRVARELRARAKARFDAAGIVVPAFPPGWTGGDPGAAP